MKSFTLILTFSITLFLCNTSCTNDDLTPSIVDEITFENLSQFNLDKSKIVDYILLLRKGIKLETLGNPGEDINLKALTEIINEVGLDNIDISQVEEDIIEPRVAGYYWKYAGVSQWNIWCLCTKYKCNKKFGSSCSNLGTGIYATAWKTYSQVQCW